MVTRRAVLIFSTAVILQLCFLAETYFYKKEQLLFQDPGILGAYNVAVHTTPHIQEGVVLKGFQVEGDKNFYNPAKKHQIQDTIGYPVLLGFLWKLTHTFSLYDIIFFQIFVFALLLVFFDKALVLLLRNRSNSLSGTLGLMFFLPFLFFNVQPVKDVYLLYGVLIFFIAIARYFFGTVNYFHLALCALLFVLCQWIRSPLFGVLCMVSITLLLFFRLFDPDIKKIFKFLTVFWVVNIFLFWVPFMTFNKITYNRYFVGCSGQAIIEGIGEFENKWGFQLSDKWFDSYITFKEPSVVGKYSTVEFDDVAKCIALEVLKEDPLILIKNSIKRIPYILCYQLPCFAQFWDYYLFYKDLPTPKDKLISIFADLGLYKSILFVMHKLYSIFIIILGWMGFLLLLKRKDYAFLVLWGSTYIGSLGLILSHIELRYIYPVMPLWGVLAGIFCYHLFLCSKKRWFALIQ